MNPVIQINQTGCGIAVAAIAGVSYQETKNTPHPSAFSSMTWTCGRRLTMLDPFCPILV